MEATHDDREQLRLLAIFHYVLASLVALVSLVPIFHLFFGLLMMSGRFDAKATDVAVEQMIGCFVVAFSAFWIVTGLFMAVCLALAGRFLTQHRRHLFCMVVAGFACLFMPVGTLLGVFTLVVLERPAVRLLFGRPVPGVPSAGPAA